MNNEIDATVQNFAPDADCLIITIGDWKVTVDRVPSGNVVVSLEDLEEGSVTLYTLGQEGETQRV